MGGRGASSGISDGGKKYGTQYRTILSEDNIKFVTKIERNSETLMETMTSGRIYVTVGGEELKNIIFFDENNKRIKQIDLDHYHKGEKPHRHDGYLHNELNDETGFAKLTDEEKKLVDRVNKIWENYLNRR